MTPTNKLRFVEREMMVPHQSVPNISLIKSVRVLQQWWEPSADSPGEWRDVPLEKEN